MENIKPREVSKETIRRFLILRQSFLQRKRGKNGTLEAIKRLGCVQTDPINVVIVTTTWFFIIGLLITSLLTWKSCFTKTGAYSSISAMQNP